MAGYMIYHFYSFCLILIEVRKYNPLRVHKRQYLLGSDFEVCTVMLKYLGFEKKN
jgi:hypothetical protein